MSKKQEQQQQQEGTKQNQGFKRFDLFGVQPNLFIDNSQKYKTNLGSCLTILLILIFFTSIYVYGKEILQKTHPTITSVEQLTSDPEKFQFGEEHFNFGFGLQNQYGQHFFNESIYSVQFVQTIVKQVEGKKELDFKEYILKGRRCKLEDFKSNQEYFKNVGYENLYCLENTDQYYLQGDYGQSLFSVMSVRVNKCDNETVKGDIKCQDEEVIQQVLDNNYYSIYFTDKTINPKNYEKPFSTYGRSIYGFSNGDSYKAVEFNFRNVHIEDNTGVIFEKTSGQRSVQFSYEREYYRNNILPNGNFLTLNMRMEKNKETKIFRDYLNVASVIAQIGGILKIIMILFIGFNAKFSKKQYNLNLINKLFSFQLSSNNEDNNKKNQQKKQQNSNGEGEEEETALKNSMYFFEKSAQQKLYQFAEKQVSDRLDINYILQKLMELEKLKMLVLNESQLKIFNYIPKPVITEEFVCQFQKPDRICESQYMMNQSQLIVANNKEKLVKQSEKFNNLLLDKKKDQPLLNDIARSAFKEIEQKPKQSQIDMKLLQLMNYEITRELENDNDSKVIVKCNNGSSSPYKEINTPLESLYNPLDRNKFFAESKDMSQIPSPLSTNRDGNNKSLIPKNSSNSSNFGRNFNHEFENEEDGNDDEIIDEEDQKKQKQNQNAKQSIDKKDISSLYDKTVYENETQRNSIKRSKEYSNYFQQY